MERLQRRASEFAKECQMNVLRAHDYTPQADTWQEFDLLTMAQVATLLHVSKAHACNLAAGRVRGCSRLPALRLGRRMLVRRHALSQWIEENESAIITPSPERGRRSA
jgi:excisionase family DNA binding protein